MPTDTRETLRVMRCTAVLKPQDSFVAVEFDTSSDLSLSDISSNHIGIDVNTVVSFASVDAVEEGIDLKSGRQITAWVEYTDATKLVQVWVSYSQIRPSNPVLQARIDLSEYVKEYMHVGFSASNGQGSAFHIVDHWRFKTYGSPSSVSPMDTTEGGDCLMCYSEDSGVNGNSTPSDLNEKRTNMREIALGLGGLAAFVLSMATVIFFVMRKKRGIGRRKRKVQIRRGQRGPTRFSIAEIKSATMGFHRNRVVGEGASATIYKGSLPSTGAVAIKRFNKGEIDCFRNPFITEFATMVGCLRHNNLVQLQGWCCEGEELVLVYEYLPNGSLDRILHNTTGSTICLSWKQRLNVVLGVAYALSYLHDECERQIIHRDVKSCNIMLDEEFNAKLGDFGLAEVYEHSTKTREATIPAGTMGYLAPEYVYSGVPSVKTDVYSFGVVVLELATGRRPVEDDGTVLVESVWSFWEKGKLIQAADAKLEGKFNEVEMERMLMVGLCCVHSNHEHRPTVKRAAKILKGEAPLPLLPPRKPKVEFLIFGLRILKEELFLEEIQSCH
ncbi:hypothetical protein GH714_000281 [Hevea brasiliensis]|uniref:non-specific serine/threonine protein kinase n=1 Tax=Hevea brasiliensis TaxID=3981 RepID=A0A6A6L585_HEVBR|nr:hypothetical protein GH714_000281 [Hevea brasiliensis]